MNKKIVLGVDFCNLLFGSYYGEELINGNGENVNAVKGFFFKLKLLKDMFQPDYIVFGSDLSRSKTFRRKLYKPYKAQRKEHNPDIIRQMNYTRQLCALLGYPFLENELYEADDLLGMLSRYATENDMYTILVSSDRDLYQLITDSTFIFTHKTKEFIDKSYLMGKYKLTPEQWIELKMLQGDRSDNIPGIQGVGEVSALNLMHEFHSIEGIYNHLGYIKPKLRQLLVNGKDILPLTRELVTIVTDYSKIQLDMNMINRKEIDFNEIYQVIYQLEIPSLVPIMEYSLFIQERKDNHVAA